MSADVLLADLDPYDLMGAESERIGAWARAADEATWRTPSRCEGWSNRDLLGHLAATEEYFHAGLEGTVADLFVRFASQGVTDIDSANALGVEERATVPTDELVAIWKRDSDRTRESMRARDGGDVDTSVGAYPTRLQAFHIAGELAAHADDLGVPVPDDLRADRIEWRTRFSCFALAESKPELAVEIEAGGGVRIAGDGFEVTLAPATFVDAVAGRLAGGADVDPAVRAALNTMP